MERWRTCSKPTIAQLEGRTLGGGGEFVMSLDMRFAAIGKTVLCQPETAVGITADELDGFVAALAARIASFPPEAVAATKRSVLAGCTDPVPGLIAEEYEFRLVRSRPAAQPRVRLAGEFGFGTRDAELGDATELYARLADAESR